MSELTVRCTVESYVPRAGGELERCEQTKDVGCHVWNDFLYLHNSCASALLANLREAIAAGRGWTAQSGTTPIYLKPCVNAPRPCGPACECGPGDDRGGWGGKNYPGIYVARDDLAAVLKKIDREDETP